MLYLLKKNWQYLGQNKKIFCFAVFLSLPIALLKSYQAYHIKNVIDVGFLSSSSMRDVLSQCLILLGLQIAQVPLRIFHLTWLKNIAEKTSLRLRDLFFKKVKTINFKNFSKLDVGQLLALSASDIRNFSNSLKEIVVLIREPMACIGFLSVAFFHDWQLALSVLCIIPVFLIILKFTGKKIKKHTFRAQEDFGKLAQKTTESLEGNIVLKTYNLQSYFLKQFESINQDYVDSKIKAIKYEEHSSPLIEIVGTCLIVFILFFAQSRMAKGELTTGEFISFFTALGMFMGPLKKVNNANKIISRGRASLNRVEAFLSEEDDQQELNRVFDNFEFESLEFKNVSFSYDDHLVLNDISFKVNRSEKAAFVGSSGSGKSTIVNLIFGLYQVDSGTILLNDLDIENYSFQALRSCFEYLPQKPYFFEGSLIDNFEMSSSIDQEKINDFFKLSKIDFISKQEFNSPRMLDPYTQFSGGQLQRLALLRAFISEKNFIVLDEATSALDADSEGELIANLNESLSGKTFLSIAHKLNTLKNFEKIFVLKDGSIVEVGDHESLINQNGTYTELYNLGNY